MSKKQEFIKFIEENVDMSEMNEEARLYWEVLCTSGEEKEKPAFTDNGKLVLSFLQQHQDTVMWKARDIAEEMFVSSRMISGSMRKLVADQYVEKIGENPVVYMLTEKGKNVIID